jgi:RES domain-containing protein
VKLIPNPRYEIFVDEMRKTKRRFSKWSGVAFRAAPLEYARIVRLLDGKGSFRYGGRWSAARFQALRAWSQSSSACDTTPPAGCR